MPTLDELKAARWVRADRWPNLSEYCKFKDHGPKWFFGVCTKATDEAHEVRFIEKFKGTCHQFDSVDAETGAPNDPGDNIQLRQE